MALNNVLFELNYEEDRALEVDLDTFTKYITTGNEGLKIFHMNVCSLRAKYHQLEILTHIMKNVFDCIVFSETHLKEEINLNQFSLGDYCIYQTKQNTRKTDGLVIYVRSTLVHEVSEVKLTDCNCMILKIKKFNKHFTCTSFYRSPNGKVDVFLSELKSVLERENEINTTKCIVGDINIDLLREQTGKVGEYLDLMAEFGYMSLVKKPTRIQKNSATCLDHVFTTLQRDEQYTAYVVQTNISDHFSTALKIEINKNKMIPTEQYAEIIKIDYEKLIRDVGEENWEELRNCSDANIAANIVTEKIQYHINQNKTSHFKKLERKIKPWITNGIIQSIKKRDKLHILSKKQPMNALLEQQYKKYRNFVNKIIEKAKIEHLKKEINQAKGDRGKMWKVVDNVIQYKGGEKSGPEKLIIEGQEISVKKETLKAANLFNQYYSEVGINAASCYTPISDPNMLQEIQNSLINVESSLYLNKITVEEIEQIIGKLKSGSAPGFDGINSEIIKHIKNHISIPLSIVFNLCLEKGVFPEQYKRAIVCPVYKKGERRLIKNYRPISLLTTFSKILERCIQKRFVKYLDENNILGKTQFGFRQGKSTTDAILELVEGVYPALDAGDKVGGAFLDLSSAFDTVDHSRMIETLSRVGVRGKYLELFKNYLGGRTQQVKLRGEIEFDNTDVINNTNRRIKSKTVLSDVIYNTPFSTPQGTVLSPTLYNVYVSGLCHLNLHGNLLSFADDTALWVRGRSWQDVFQKIQEDIRKIKNWFQYHNLFLNTSKTVILPITINASTLPSETEITIHERQNCPPTCQCNVHIEVVKQTKYLGLEIDCHLRWDKHIMALTKRLRRYIYPFLSLRTFIGLPFLKEIYFALAQSAIEYGISAYGRADPTTIKSLCTVQNTLLKIIYKKERRYPTETLYKELKILNVKKIFEKNICTFIHTNKSNLIKHKETKFPLRQIIPQTPKCKRSKGQKSLKFMGIKMYEKIPEGIRNVEKMNIFKMKLKSWLKECEISDM